MQTVEAQKNGGSSRLGGARADFVASLGRKLVDLRAALARVRETPDDVPRREELRRKLHALASGAKMMKFDSMERAIAEALGTIDRTPIDASLDQVDIDGIEQVLEDLPALAWGESPQRSSPTPAPVGSEASQEPPKAVPAYTALVVGPSRIAEALLEMPSADRPTFACECTEDAQAAFDLARSLDPDVVVLDGDLEYALELVEALMDDSATERTPIIVVGAFKEQGESSRFTAMGVARTITKPTSREMLRFACERTLDPGEQPKDAEAAEKAQTVVADERGKSRTRGDAADVRLQGRRVVVADDDPSVVWFLADTLKAAGCTVYEAFDGEQALEAAYRTSPDLVLADILMPKIDGLTLCRSLKRDVALRDVPVILLSWKEDLLQRARELGAGAAGYLRKETDTSAVLARVREALRARSRIEGRLREDGEVRGRLDGVSVRTLLEIVCATRPEARVTVRDATFVYEVEVRFGAPYRATRSSGDATSMRGTKVLAAMLGVGAARFTVTPSLATIEAELDGNLAAQLAKPIAKARAATALLTGGPMMTVEKVVFDDDALGDYLRATPEPAQSVMRRIANGEAPRAIIVAGECHPALLEDLMCDLSSRGVVLGIEGAEAKDLLSPAIERLLEHSDARAAFAPRTATPAPDAAMLEAIAAESCSADPGPVCESPYPSPSSLEDAVMREVAHRSPTPMQLALPKDSVIIDPAILSPRPAAYEPTPPHDQMVALAEPTIIDNTCYAAIAEDQEDEHEESIPIDEASRPMALESDAAVIIEREQRMAKTPLTTVTTSEPPRPAPVKRRAWPMLAFVAATAGVVYAVVHFTGTMMPARKATEHAPPPPPAVTVIPAPNAEEVTYSNVSSSANLAAGQGVLDVAAPAGATVVVDGAERGHGGATLPLSAGTHDVRVKKASTPTSPATGTAGDDMCTVEVRAGKVVHKRF